MKLDELVQDLLILNDKNFDDIDILAVIKDTREVVPSSLFCCIKGEMFDGHDHVEEAVTKGAVVIVAERPVTSVSCPVVYVPDTKKALAYLANRFYQFPSRLLEMYGITGTNGKTTITHLIIELLHHLKQTTGLIGTMYNKVNESIRPTINTTPDSLTLQSLLSEMVTENVTHCAMEVSSHALIQGRVWGVDYDVAVFTNLTQDHLDYHKTMENYFQAKSLLFSGLESVGRNRAKAAVINIDDKYGRELLPLTAANCITYGIESEDALIRAKDIQLSSSGTQFIMSVFNQEYQVHTRVIGRFNILNSLAAVGSCLASGFSLPDILDGLGELHGVHGRFEMVPNQMNDVLAIVDYAHTPDALQNVLETIRDMSDSRIICVVGCGGDRDKTKRPIMANVAMDFADVRVFTSDNPRTENPEMILDDMVVGLDSNSYFRIENRKDAIEFALQEARPKDVVIVAGKGHEDYQIIGKEKHHFDDSEVISQYANK